MSKTHRFPNAADLLIQMFKPVFCITLAAFSLQSAAVSVELIAPKGYYIQYSDGLFTPSEDSVFSLKDLTQRQRSLLKPIFDNDKKELNLLDAEIKRKSADQWLQMQKVLTHTQSDDALERSKKKGRLYPIFTDTMHARDLTADQTKELLTIQANDKTFALENRRNDITAKQGELLKSVLTVTQLAELQNHR